MVSKFNSLVLGSASPRRVELLEKIMVKPNLILPADINESVLKNEKPNNYVKRIAMQKNLACVSLLPTNMQTCLVLTADTVVVKSNKILQKPADENEAINMLQMLSGSRHKVLTSFVVQAVINGKVLKKSQKIITTTVTVKQISIAEMQWYLSTNQWQGKSGGYGIQGAFEVFVKQINGCYSNIIGLPIFYVKNTLAGLGYEFNY